MLYYSPLVGGPFSFQVGGLFFPSQFIYIYIYIYSEFKVIRTGNSFGKPSQRAGLELMDMMAVYQEGAYERLCR